MLAWLRALWCERRGHRYQVVARLYSGPQGQAREVLLEACRVCGARRHRRGTTEALVESVTLDEESRLRFLARARRRALRRSARGRT